MTSLKELIEKKAIKAEYTKRGIALDKATLDAIVNKCIELDSFALPRKDVNVALGWPEKTIGNQRIKIALNKKHPLGNDGIWHVGHTKKTDMYIFTIK